jgi:hypothetical protein
MTGATIVGIAFFAAVPGCGEDFTALLNPTFVNTLSGANFPLAPRPENEFVLVRVVNTTSDPISFLVTAERATVVGDEDEMATVIQTQTTELFTQPGSNVNEAGVLFECPISRIGLGQNLNQPQSDPALFVGGMAAGDPGFGVPGNINPLSAVDGAFQCGDTVIFQAIVSTNSVGGFRVQAFVLLWELQPEDTLRDTFGSVRTFLDEGR